MKTISCLFVGWLIPSSSAFLQPHSKLHVARHTRCHATPSLKTREQGMTGDMRNAENNLNQSNKIIEPGQGLNIEFDTKTQNQSKEQLSTQNTLELGQDVQDQSSQWILFAGTTAILAAVYALGVTMTRDMGLDLEWEQLIQDPSTSFDTLLSSLSTFHRQKGMVYFSAFYILAEILAIPAVPILTASSGYLFGLFPGTAVCLFSAAIAASVSFVIGRTILRGYVESILEDNPKFRSMDRAVEKEGFKLMLLLRLSPLFPFALSNYLYGASSIQFWNYFFGTLLGFAPGTFAYVYAGEIGKALTVENSANSAHWYVYVGGMVVLGGLLKIAGDVASEVVKAIDVDE